MRVSNYLFVYLLIALSLQACKKDPPFVNSGRPNEETFCASNIKAITMPQTDVYYSYPFDFSGCPITFGGRGVVADSNIYLYMCANPNNKNEFCYLGSTSMGWQLYTYNICNGQSKALMLLPIWNHTSWNVDGYIYHSSKLNGIGRINASTGEAETLFNENGNEYKIAENAIKTGAVLFLDLSQKYLLYDVNSKLYTDTIPRISGKPIVISDSTIAFVNNIIRIYNLNTKKVTDSFMSSCYTAHGLLNNIYLSFDRSKNVIYHLSYGDTISNRKMYKFDLNTGIETSIPSHNYSTYNFNYFHVIDNYMIKSRIFYDGLYVPKCFERYRQRISIENMTTGEERDLRLPGLL